MTPFARLLSTRYDPEREPEALQLLDQFPDLARQEWRDGDPFIEGSTALHYAANDGKLRLIERLLDLGADVNASGAHWFRSVLSWAANNARIEAVQLLLSRGARPDSLDALHAAAWGGSDRGRGREQAYAQTLKLLIDAGADKNDRRSLKNQTPLSVALESGNTGAIEFLMSIGAAEA